MIGSIMLTHIMLVNNFHKHLLIKQSITEFIHINEWINGYIHRFENIIVFNNTRLVIRLKVMIIALKSYLQELF